jgi:hypothetical protein
LRYRLQRASMFVLAVLLTNYFSSDSGHRADSAADRYAARSRRCGSNGEISMIDMASRRFGY